MIEQWRPHLVALSMQHASDRNNPLSRDRPNSMPHELRKSRLSCIFLVPAGSPPSLTPAQQKEATKRRAQGATLQELADSYDRSIPTMRRATRSA
jgi:hypothetical protein